MQKERNRDRMIRINDPNTTDFQSIDIDPFWNMKENICLKMHSIHAYPAKFPPFLTSRTISYAQDMGVVVDSVSDIFCGCGTVALEAKRLGINFWGCDLSPTAILIAKTKSQQYSISILEKNYKDILEYFELTKGNHIANEYSNERIRYWFHERQIINLSCLLSSIRRVTPERSKYRLFFECAFSNILKGASNWLTKSIKPQRDPSKISKGVIDLFSSQCLYMIKAASETIFHAPSEVVIERKNSLTLRRKEVCDLLLCSPPYVTSYEYADLHQLSNLWLGYTDDYRALRNNSIGSSYNCKSVGIKDLNKSGEHIYSQLRTVDKNKAHAVAKYHSDIQRITTVSRRLLKTNGICIMIIGNTSYKGVLIDNAKHLAESMLESGFTDVRVSRRAIKGKILTPYRNKDGTFSSVPTERQIYSDEYIIAGR